MNKNILLLEDYDDTRTWISSNLQLIFSSPTIHEASSIIQAHTLLNIYTFDVAIIDLSLPDGSGIEILRRIAQSSPETFSVVATIHRDDRNIFDALKVGAQGYLLKTPPDQMITRLEGILNGDPPLSPDIARRVLQHFNATSSLLPSSDLTKREAEVLRYVAKGMTRSEISQYLSITKNTAADHIKNIYRKLNVCSRAEAAIKAERMGLLRE